MDGVTFEDDHHQFYGQWSQQESTHMKQVYSKDNKMEEGSLFGMTCDGYDIIARNIALPELQIGDWLVLAGMGSYTYGPKSTFNGMHALDTVYVHHSTP